MVFGSVEHNPVLKLSLTNVGPREWRQKNDSFLKSLEKKNFLDGTVEVSYYLNYLHYNSNRLTFI